MKYIDSVTRPTKIDVKQEPCSHIQFLEKKGGAGMTELVDTILNRVREVQAVENCQHANVRYAVPTTAHSLVLRNRYDANIYVVKEDDVDAFKLWNCRNYIALDEVETLYWYDDAVMFFNSAANATEMFRWINWTAEEIVAAEITPFVSRVAATGGYALYALQTYDNPHGKWTRNLLVHEGDTVVIVKKDGDIVITRAISAEEKAG